MDKSREISGESTQGNEAMSIEEKSIRYSLLLNVKIVFPVFLLMMVVFTFWDNEIYRIIGIIATGCIPPYIVSVMILNEFTSRFQLQLKIFTLVLIGISAPTLFFILNEINSWFGVIHLSCFLIMMSFVTLFSISKDREKDGLDYFFQTLGIAILLFFFISLLLNQFDLNHDWIISTLKQFGVFSLVYPFAMTFYYLNFKESFEENLEKRMLQDKTLELNEYLSSSTYLIFIAPIHIILMIVSRSGSSI